MSGVISDELLDPGHVKIDILVQTDGPHVVPMLFERDTIIGLWRFVGQRKNHPSGDEAILHFVHCSVDFEFVGLRRLVPSLRLLWCRKTSLNIFHCFNHLILE